ncbi:hypothetical protein NKH84_26455 [Mesorhizobium sp. M0902]|uniref:hypothetical protein n=1 Tax=Mesorhizobium sp. M0902 TaxID=2957021 RepID=UPI003339CB73
MTLFGFASGWWSVVGQISDLGGVAILTFDLWPEYRLHKARRAIDSAKRRNLELKVLNLQLAEKDNRPTLDKHDELESARRDVLSFQIDSSRMQASADTMIAAGYLKTTMPEVYSDEFRDPTAWFDKAVDALEKLEETKRHEVRRARPPIGWGIFLIGLGFVLQIIGSMPL